MKKRYTLIVLNVYTLLSVSIYAQQADWTTDFFKQDKPLKVIGRGECHIADGILTSKDAYACFGSPNASNYTITFRARAPRDAEQVQISLVRDKRRQWCRTYIYHGNR